MLYLRLSNLRLSSQPAKMSLATRINTRSPSHFILPNRCWTVIPTMGLNVCYIKKMFMPPHSHFRHYEYLWSLFTTKFSGFGGPWVEDNVLFKSCWNFKRWFLFENRAEVEDTLNLSQSSLHWWFFIFFFLDHLILHLQTPMSLPDGGNCFLVEWLSPGLLTYDRGTYTFIVGCV